MHIYEKSRPTGKVSGIMANTIELKQRIAQGEYDAAFVPSCTVQTPCRSSASAIPT